MTFERKDNTGSIFVNDRKTEDTHPDRTGSAMIGGTEYWVHGWLRKSTKGAQYLALSFRPKDAQAAGQSKPQAVDNDASF